ncbi:MAG: hypothetical protein JOZ15_18945 [Acidobacteria bacterium]|nr:hypothetical protein [Acidobacteriota bacterium]
MTDRADSSSHPWLAAARLALAEVVVPVGVAAAAGVTLAATISPRWRAAGGPYFQGYGKNVESAAVAGALAAGAATQWLVRSRRGLAAGAALAALGLALVALHSPVAPLLTGWPQLLAVAGLATALGIGRRGRALAGPPVGSDAEPGRTAAERDRVDAEPGRAVAERDRVDAEPGRTVAERDRRDVPVPAAALLVGVLAAATFALDVGPAIGNVDTFHHGEVLSTAVDLVRGGRPFKTLLWPHGFHDTGLAALWILATGKVGTSPVALAWASCCGLGVVAMYVVVRRILGSRCEALAVCLVAALTPLLSVETQTGAGTWALYQFGELFFVAAAFAAVVSRRRRCLVAGLCCGLAYIFRIETGLYGCVAALAVIAYRDLVATAEPFAKAVKTAAGSVLRLAAGAALLLAGARLVLGWPGAEWYAYTLWELPRFHRDAVGIALPWPHRRVDLSLAEAASLGMALARLLLVLLLLVQAAREVLARRPARLPAGSERAAQLLFMAVFAAAATKTALDRSDPAHLLQWTALPLLAAGCLVLAGWRRRQSWGRLRSSVAAMVLVALLDFDSLGFRIPVPRAAAELAALLGERRHSLAEHLAPNPPAGGCADRMLTPSESRLPANRDFIAGTCAVETLLRAHGIDRLFVADSAPWYYVRFRVPLPTRYIATARAYTPPRQLELIRELRASRPQALLLVHGFYAIAGFDVPDAVRVPVLDAYLRGRRHGVAVTPTPLGDLFFWDEPGECAPAPHPGGGAGSHVVVEVERPVYQPASGLLFARGWASEAAMQRPLDALVLRNAPPGADFEFGFDRTDAAEALHREALRHAGWELRSRGSLPPAPLAFDAIAADGRADRVTVELPPAHVLGPLSGDEWQDLAGAIDRAAAMGRADRARALAAAVPVAAAAAAARPAAAALRRSLR